MSKPLSDKQAQACENATQLVCKCRCGGALHGAKRGGTAADGGLDRAFFESLSEDDPHYLPSAAVKKARKRIATLTKWAERWEKEGLHGAAAYYRREIAELQATVEAGRAG